MINIEPFGEFEFFRSDDTWLARTKNIIPDLEIELSIENENPSVFSLNKIPIIADFLKDINFIEGNIYQYIFEKFQYRKPLDKLKETYFLSALELKKDNKTWWMVYEPFCEMETIHNVFLRFTIMNKTIIWSNL